MPAATAMVAMVVVAVAMAMASPATALIAVAVVVPVVDPRVRHRLVVSWHPVPVIVVVPRVVVPCGSGGRGKVADRVLERAWVLVLGRVLRVVSVVAAIAVARPRSRARLIAVPLPLA